MTVLENNPPYAPPKPDKVHSCESSRLSSASPGDPAACAAADGAQGLLRAEAGAADQRHRRDGRDPRHHPRVDMPLLQIGDQAGNLLGQAHQPAQQPHDDTGARGDRHPPPLPAEPARIGIDIPAAPEPDHPHEHQTGERAEHPQGQRISHEHPELAILSERGRAAGSDEALMNANPPRHDSSTRPPPIVGLPDRAVRRVPGPEGLAVADRTVQYRDLYHRRVPRSSLSRDSEPAAVAGSWPLVVSGVVGESARVSRSARARAGRRPE